MLSIKLIILCCLYLSSTVDGARILGVFPFPSISHQVVFRAYMLELAKHGHELVIITPNPALPKQRPPDNITEIDIGGAYKIMATAFTHDSFFNLKRGVIIETSSRFTKEVTEFFIEMMTFMFKEDEVKKLLNDKSQKFDLIVAEGIGNYHLITARIFKAPVILFPTFSGSSEQYAAMGTIGWHPIYYPNVFRMKYQNLSFWGKLKEIYMEWQLYCNAEYYESLENKMLKEQFGPDAPTVAELKEDVNMLFVYSHPIFDNNRPVPPSVIYLGALHMRPRNSLPQDLKDYLDNSTRGVIYVSLGTNVRPSFMDKELLDAFVQAFEKLPYDILWKFDGDNLLNIPKNVKIQKWFPQRDLLHHPNIKLFVTQGGLQSADETIDAAVPVVGIPILGDQWHNVNKYVELGVGEQVDALTMTATDLINAATKVIHDPSYKQNMMRLRDVIKDQPQTPIERAVWWTEYLLRHGGSHLRAPSANTTWIQYYMLDIVAVLVVSVIAVLVTIIYVSFRIYNAYKNSQTRTSKTKQS